MSFPQGLYRSVREEQFLRHKCYQGERCVQLCEEASERVCPVMPTQRLVIYTSPDSDIFSILSDCSWVDTLRHL